MIFKSSIFIFHILQSIWKHHLAQAGVLIWSQKSFATLFWLCSLIHAEAVGTIYFLSLYKKYISNIDKVKYKHYLLIHFLSNKYSWLSCRKKIFYQLCGNKSYKKLRSNYKHNTSCNETLVSLEKRSVSNRKSVTKQDWTKVY
jgi:hypothetical protein